MITKRSIDINCDVGEGIGNEALLMPFISSCSIACGGHAGDISSIDQVVSLAKKHNVKIGAHPSFPDRENFGRAIMNMAGEALQKSIEEQILLLAGRAELLGLTVHHVKPHGALYNLIAKDVHSAQIAVAAIKNTLPHAYIYVPYNSVIEKVALENGIKVKYEAFADRNYNADLSLVARSERHALITDKNAVLLHVENIIFNECVDTKEGKVTIKADTLCVHGDTENAVDLVTHIHEHLTAKEIKIA